jgi:hypothetical protein
MTMIATEADLLAQSASFDGIREKILRALQNVCNGREPMVDRAEYAPGDNCYCWIRDLFKAQVVYSCDGIMYQRDYKVSGSKITFGDATKVEIAYKPLGESARQLLKEAVQLTEAKYDKANKSITMTVIRPGRSKNNKFYSGTMLKRDHKVFEGVKMFANHQTDAEQRTRPEGDVNQWVATLKETWCEEDGTVKGKAIVFDPLFAAKLENLAEANLLNEMGTSIRAIGEASEAEVDGEQCVMVERFIKARSVDFVTYAGAGGQVETLESDRNDDEDLELVTEAALRKRRPDLVSIIESSALKESEAMKTVEQQLQEATTALTSANAENAKLTARITALEADTKKATVTKALDEALAAAKLPAKAEEKLRKQFATATEATGIKEAVEAEREYIKSFAPAAVKGMGVTTQETEEADKGGEGAEYDPKLLVESFKALGMNEAEAKKAAGI